MRRSVLLTLVAAALVAAGCGSDAEPPDQDAVAAAPRASTAVATTTASTRTADRARPRNSGTAIRLRRSQFGKVLFDGADQAIYLFDKERSSRSRCYGQCAREWPPVLTDGRPRAGRGIDRRLLGTTKRKGGSTQVTYNGHPLYTYAHEGRDEVRCHDVPGFGGTWYALDRRGDVA